MAEIEQLDRRVRRSRRLMGEALVNLIVEKGYETVTILNVTERADVAYSTFFRHYDSIDELLVEVLEQGLGGIRAQIEVLAQQAAEHPINEEGYLIFKHVEENADLFRILLSSPAAKRVCVGVTGSIAALFLRTCPALSAADDFIPGKLAAHHIATSLLSLIEWWLDQEMALRPEHMGRIYAKLVTGATIRTVVDLSRSPGKKQPINT